MTDNLDNWVSTMLVKASVSYGETQGGRIVGGLAKDPNVDRKRLGALLLAAVLQERDERFETYLDDISGVSHSSTSRESGEPEEAPEDRPEYSRPNGSKYFARKWGNFWDVELLKQAREAVMFPLLTGPPGTGKTAMAEAAFGDHLETVSITGETRVDELVGSFIPDGNNGFFWVDGPLLTAVREGRPILLDEVLLGDSKMLSVLYPLMDGRGFLDVTANPEIGIVPAKEGFFIIGTGNPNVPGARISEALLSRFTLQTEVTTDWELLETGIGVDPVIVSLASALDARRRSGSLSWSPQFREVQNFHEIEKRWGRPFAVSNLLRLVPEADYSEVKSIAGRTLNSALLKQATI